MVITGSITEKNGKWHMVANLYDTNGKRHKKWKSTGLEVRGNKKNAEQLLNAWLTELNCSSIPISDLLFADYLESWLDLIKREVKPNTFQGYSGNLVNHVIPYFRVRRIRLQELKPCHLEEYYREKSKPGSKKNSTEALTPNTIKHHHQNISKALNDAVRQGLIPGNPAQVARTPKIPKYKAAFLNPEQINTLLKLFKGTVIELPIILIAFYGLRRSEVLGLKWCHVDFINRKITIAETLQQHVGGDYIDSPKTDSSYRTLPMTDRIYEILKAQKELQNSRKELMGDFYTTSDYVCTWPDGKVIAPNYLTSHFHRAITNSTLPKIRLHDLRHSTASNLLAQGFSIVQVQEWLGHGSPSTTLNIYSHIDKTSKTLLADRLGGILVF